MKYWLMKTEPDTFSWDDLELAPDRTGSWDGVRNFQARNFMRDDFKFGDLVFIYHSSCAEPGIIGLAEVVREAYPDPTALSPSSDYYDERAAKKGQNPWVMVDVKAKQKFARPLSLQEIRNTKALKNMLVLRPGQRLSIQPVDAMDAEYILKNFL